MTEIVEWGVRRGRTVQMATAESARKAGITREQLARNRAESSGDDVALVKRVRTITTTEWEVTR